VINSLIFSINFNRFSDHFTEIKFNTGLHIIYGESSVGKSKFAHSFYGRNIGNDGNFEISILQSPTNVQFISQNPENQIVSDSIDGELAFSLECHYTNSDLIQGKLLKLKNELPSYTAGSRHPATLSGGEMELLNIITGFSTSPEFIIIDDSLSFINDTMKRKVIQKIQDNIQNKKQIVLWLTSEITDLQFSQSQWELSLSSFSKRIPSMKSVYPVKKIKAGKLNLELNSLSFKYNAERKIFDGINEYINNARSLGIVGDNGSGKTTLASILLGFHQPNSGTVKLSINRNYSPRIAYLDQFPERLIGERSLEDLLNEFVEGDRLQPQLVQKIITIMKRNQIKWDFIKDKPSCDLSWSILRLAFIIILSHCEFDLLILDEPTFGFGWKQKLNLHKYLLRYLIQKHLIIISHDIDFVQNTCDYVFSLNNHTSIIIEKTQIGTKTTKN